MRQTTDSSILANLLNDTRIDRTRQRRITYYAATDLLTALSDVDLPDPAAAWAELKRSDASLAGLARTFEATNTDGSVRHADFLDLPGVLRVVQAVRSRRAEPIKRWLATAGVERLQATRDPDRPAARSRQLYERRGFDRPWVNQRLRAVRARQDLTSEWARRGATDSEHFRALTNELMNRTFGMDVETYRRHKGLTGSPTNLRDRMTDLELTLTELSEATAAALHKARGSQGVVALLKDTADAGEIVATARRQIEASSGHHRTAALPVVEGD
ncbi:MAG TPA: hypothetical protein VGN72_15865 [Tepidisphaeraceae bacterium]|jgi:hypothetical protein|nr:hypothetical protein [Tepidisphaeraceae bacterium]